MRGTPGLVPGRKSPFFIGVGEAEIVMSVGGLKRSMGLWAAVSTAVGLVVASTTLVSLGQGFGIGGPGFIFAMLIALVLNLFVAFSFAELSSILPKAGSLNHYTLSAMGPFPAILAVLAGYVIVTIFAGSAEAAVPGIVFNEVFAAWMSPIVFSVGMVLLLTVVNLLGVDLFAYVQMAMTGIMIGSMDLLGLIGNLGIPGPAVNPEVFANFNPMGLGVASLASLGFWLFVGIEYVCPMAEEIKQPRKYIPLAMILALAIIAVSNILFGFASLRYLPLDQLAGSTAPHVDTAVAMLGPAGGIWIGIVTIFASVSTVNTLLAAIPRMLYGMAQQGQLPSFLAYIHPRFQTPWAGILLVAACIITPILVGIATVETVIIYILAGALAWFVAYIIAHLNVIILRAKYPSAPRSFKTPLYPWPQLLGIGGMVYMIFNIFPDPEMKASIYKYALGFLLAAAVFSAVWVKAVMKKGLFETQTIESLGSVEPAGDFEMAAVPAMKFERGD